ncbi:MAG: tetratricopeptide repeat protein, partial [Saprospiraceae bacterium]
MRPITTFLVVSFHLFFLFLPLGKTTAQDAATLASRYLQRAQELRDSMQYEKALAKAQEAEKLLLDNFGENDVRLADAFCMAGLCLLRLDTARSLDYLQKVMALGDRLPPLTQAHAHFFKGLFLHLKVGAQPALDEYQQAISLYEGDPIGRKHPNLCSLYTNCGYIVASEFNYEAAYSLYGKAIELGSEIYGPTYPILSPAYGNTGKLYMEQGYMREARQYFEKSLAILRTLGEAVELNLAISYINIALIHVYELDLERASNYLDKALFIALKKNVTSFLSPIYTNYGVIYSKKHEPAKALEYFEKALGIEKMLYGSQYHPDVAISLFNIATTYEDMGDFEKALMYIQQAIGLAKSDNPYLVKMQSELGNYYLNQRKTTEAREALQIAFDKQLASTGEYHPLTANVYFNLARVAKQEGNYAEALEWNERAKKSLGYEKSEGLSNVVDVFQFCELLLQESQLHWHFRENSVARVENTLHAAKWTLDVCDTIGQSFVEPSSKLELQAFIAGAIELAIASNLAIGDPNGSKGAFQLLERSKALLLHEAMQETNALHISGIPDSLLEKEYGLRMDIALYDKRRQEALVAGAAKTDSTLLAIGSKRFDLSQEYEALKAKFEASYPSYFNAKYSLATIPLGVVQSDLLQPGQCLLEYFVGDSSIFAFLVRQDTFFVTEVKHDFPLDEWVNNMTRDGIYGFHSLPPGHPQKTAEREDACNENYTRAAQDIYQKLVAPVADELTDEVIIVPDGVLGYLPFEALLTQPPKSPGRFASYHDAYFLNKHQISYCYSATLLREMLQKRHYSPPTGNLLAMAPFYFDGIDSL